MQSLLFTEQIQSGGKAARRDTLEVDLKEILPEVILIIFLYAYRYINARVGR